MKKTITLITFVLSILIGQSAFAESSLAYVFDAANANQVTGAGYVINSSNFKENNVASIVFPNNPKDTLPLSGKLRSDIKMAGVSGKIVPKNPNKPSSISMMIICPVTKSGVKAAAVKITYPPHGANPTITATADGDHITRISPMVPHLFSVLC